MTTFDIGRRAEAVAADFLVNKGCTIIHQNWRNRWCEIDIVAMRGNTVYLCEVKYRSTGRQGYGLDYITPKKHRQMRLAAAHWVARHHWSGHYELCAIEVSGPSFRITGVVRDL